MESVLNVAFYVVVIAYGDRSSVVIAFLLLTQITLI
jgi:hypothetical protein